MKNRILSVLLVIALLSGLFPAFQAPAVAQAAGVGTYNYVFNAVDGTEWMGDENDPDHMAWAYFESSTTGANTSVSIVNDGVQFGNSNGYISASGGYEWFKLKFKVPTAGKYKLSIDTMGGSYYVGTNVYICPDGTNPFSATAYHKGTIPQSAADGVYTTDLGEVTFDTAGTYIIGFYMNVSRSYYFNIQSMKLAWVPPTYNYVFNAVDGTEWMGDENDPDHMAWAYFESSTTGANTSVSIVNDGVQFGNSNGYISASGGYEWFKLKFKVPTAGEYKLSIDTMGGSNYVGTNVYICPDGTNPFSASAYHKGTIPQSAADGVYTTDLGEVTFDTAGTYIIGFYMNVSRSYYFNIQSMKLRSAGGQVLDCVVPSEADWSLYPGQSTGAITLAGYDTDGERLGLNSATVVWSSSSEAVATVADGVITAVAAGTATVKASVTLDDVTKEAEIAVTVADAPSVSNEKLVYQLTALELGKWQGDLTDVGNMSWRLADYSKTTKNKNMYLRDGGLSFGDGTYPLRSEYHGFEYFFVTIQVPQAGTYTIETRTHGAADYGQAEVRITDYGLNPLKTVSVGIIGNIPEKKIPGDGSYLSRVGTATFKKAGLYTVAFMMLANSGLYFSTTELALVPEGYVDPNPNRQLAALELPVTETNAYSGEEGIQIVPQAYNTDGLAFTLETNEMTWSSDNPEIATISETGVVKGVSAGTTTLRVAAASGGSETFNGEVTVTVSDRQAEIYTYVFNQVPGEDWIGALSDPNNMPWGFQAATETGNASLTMRNGYLSFDGNSRYQNGFGPEYFVLKFQVPVAGEYVLEMTNFGGQYFGCGTVWVGPEGKLPVNDEACKLGAVPYGTGTYVTEVGDVVFDKPGTYTIGFLMDRISGYYFNIKQMRLIPMSMRKPLDSVSLSEPDWALYPGQKSSVITAIGADEDGKPVSLKNATIEWTSASSEIAAVSDGTITAVGAGTTTITATVTLRGVTKQAQATVTVADVPDVNDGKIVYQLNALEQNTWQGDLADIGNMAWRLTEYSTGTPNKNMYLRDGGLSFGDGTTPLRSGSALEYFFVNIQVPKAGTYSIETKVRGGEKDGRAELWIANYGQNPHQIVGADKGDIPTGTAGEDGFYNAYVGEVTFETAGMHTVSFLMLQNSGYYFTVKELALIPEGYIDPTPYENLSITVDPLKSMNVYTEQKVGFVVKDEAGSVLRPGAVQYEVISANPSVAEASIQARSGGQGGILTVNSKNAGSTTVTINAMSHGKVAGTVQLNVTVTEPELASIAIGATSKFIKLGDEPLQLTIAGTDTQGKPSGVAPEFIRWTSSNPEFATMSADGLLTPVAAGTVTVKAEVNAYGFSGSAETQIIVSAGKTRSSYYTEERLKNAWENIEKYAWAREIKDSAVAAAEKWLDEEEYLWNLVPSQEIPRSISIGFYANGEEGETCKYCKTYLVPEFGKYSWIVDAKANPWKIRCPKCRRLFPSNDFESFYELGLDMENGGKFNYEKALAANAELVAEGKDGYLKNILYPEMEGTTLADGTKAVNWGVDDSRGAITGTQCTFNGLTTENRATYIGYYAHWGLWYTGSIYKALTALTDAYVYTGDRKYGRVGAILLDRIADVYPEMTNKGNNPVFVAGPWGTTSDGIWSTGLATQYVKSYDAFFPAYEDPYVIRFLSEKAADTGMANPKDTADAIRKNGEENIVAETLRDLQNRDIMGNFGMHQETAAFVAVVADSMPVTQDAIDWLYADGLETASAGGVNPGGNMFRQMFSYVDRDGNGNEAAPGYNAGWIKRLARIADIFAAYEGVPEEANLYENPKFLKMFYAQLPLTMVRKWVAPIGDCGGLATPVFATDTDTLLRAYERTGDPQFAQFVYFLNGNKSTGLHYDIFSPNAGEAAAHVQEIIDTYGEYAGFDESTMQAGYGFAALRDGTYHKATLSENTRDTQRDFWMYFGYSGGKGNRHSHDDTLSLQMDAYGIAIAPEFGYPSNWSIMYSTRPTLAHNTVQINGMNMAPGIEQNNGNPAFPMHFDDSGMVKLMDVEASGAWAKASEYRRTVVSINVDDEISYGVDFFNVTGGKEHVYAFHPLSNEVAETEGLNPQSRGGTYAGEDVEYGSEIGTVYNEAAYMTDIREDKAIANNVIAVDWKIDDLRKNLAQPKDVHLRLTMWGAEELSDFTMAKMAPPQVDNNPEQNEFALARRKGRDGLSSVFTAVLEPYANERYVDSIEEVTVTKKEDGSPVDRTVAAAVKVTLKNGRVDYIVRSKDNTLALRVGDLFDFTGFVGVQMYKGEDVVYSYVNDGAVIGDMSGAGAVTGTVSDFTQELSSDNYIWATLDQEIDAASLAGNWIYVDNDKKDNAAYPIVGAERLEDGRVKLDLGDITLIRNRKSQDGFNLTFNYNIAAGQTFRIPLAKTAAELPKLLLPTEHAQLVAGNTYTWNIGVEAAEGRTITLEGVNLPRGMSLEGNILKWTPSSNQIGEAVAVVSASDGVFTVSDEICFTVVKSASGNGGSSSGGTTGGDTTGGDTTGGDTTGGDTTGGDTTGGDTTGGDTTGGDTTGGDTTGGDTTGERFIDLGGHSWAKDAIYRLVDAGVVNGTSHNTYSPAKNITRADFAIMLVRAFGITEGEGENFADVPEGAYYAEELRLAKAAGIVLGIGENKFNPTGEITRQDMMVMLVRALKAVGQELSEADVSVLAQFADSALVAEYAREAAASLVSAELIAGSNGKLNPLGLATRAEVAVLLDRILSK